MCWTVLSRKLNIYREFLVALLGIPALFFVALEFSHPSIAAAIVAAGVPLSFHTYRIFVDKPHVAKLDESGTKLIMGDFEQDNVIPLLRVYVELENYGKRTAPKCYAKLNRDGSKTYTRWHLINEQYVDFHPTDERRVVLARLIPSEDLINELRNQITTDVTVIEPDNVGMFQLGHTVELSGNTFYVDCPIQEEQERRVLERNEGGDPDIYMGRVLKTGKRLEGVLEIAAEDFKAEKDVKIDLEDLLEKAEWREDHKNSYQELAEEFENLLQD